MAKRRMPTVFASVYSRRLPTTSYIASAAPLSDCSIIGRSRARSAAVSGRDPSARRRATSSIALTTLAEGKRSLNRSPWMTPSPPSTANATVPLRCAA